MKRNLFTTITILLTLIALTTGCGKDAPLPPPPPPGIETPEEEIPEEDTTNQSDEEYRNKVAPLLGQWEYCANGDEADLKPKGYMELFPDSLIGWFEYATKEYKMIALKYKIDSASSLSDKDTIGYLRFIPMPYDFNGSLLDKNDIPAGDSFKYAFKDGLLHLSPLGSSSETREPLVYKHIEHEKENWPGAIIYKNEKGVIALVEFPREGNVYSPDTAEIFFREILKMQKEDEFRLVSLGTDKDHEMYDEVFEQYYKGMRVYGVKYVFFYYNRRISFAGGNYVRIVGLDISPSITEEEAARSFAAYQSIPFELVTDYNTELFINGLSMDEKRSPILVYRISLNANHKNNDGAGHVNAHTGEVIAVEQTIIYD